jgi:uncharacterized LabA/DUF88 family protein
MSREIAILIDGGFLTKRLPKLVGERHHKTPANVVGSIRFMCHRHVERLTGDKDPHWHQHVYRIFYYDALPFEGQAHHPLTNKQIDFGKSDRAKFQNEIFDLLKKERNVALRLGKVNRLGGWQMTGNRLQKLFATQAALAGIDFSAALADGTLNLTAAQVQSLAKLNQDWQALENHHVALDLRQKGVDMRIGLDIASLTLKRLAKTIVLIAGDSDFVPAAKLARREGLQFILDPLWQKVNDDLYEHIDGLQSGLPRPMGTAPAAQEDHLKDPA